MRKQDASEGLSFSVLKQNQVASSHLPSNMKAA